jgi:hypothetical protein
LKDEKTIHVQMKKYCPSYKGKPENNTGAMRFLFSRCNIELAAKILVRNDTQKIHY